MKKLILAMTLFCALLLPCFSQKDSCLLEKFAELTADYNEGQFMETSIEEIEKIIYNSSKEIQFLSNREIFELKLLKKCRFLYFGYSLILGIWIHKELDEIFMYYIVIKGDRVEKKFGLADPITELSLLMNFEKSFFFKQISLFKILDLYSFQYDFNHDGNDEILSFTQSSITGYIHCKIYVIDIYSDNIKIAFDVSSFPSFSIYPEFINYNFRQGLKVYSTDSNEWQFYYYDHIQQKYVQDESAKGEELEQIHGSPDFFAEAGIDYAKLERPLLPADLEGFSKPALRIWRNAVYARHGRTFRSEDLQSLFNVYAWYKPDNEYTEDKLTDIDRANIKLIQEFEKK